MAKEWWREKKNVVFKGESDGQQYLCVARRDTDTGPEVAAVLCSDGDGLAYVYGGVTIYCSGTVTEIPSDR